MKRACRYAYMKLARLFKGQVYKTRSAQVERYTDNSGEDNDKDVNIPEVHGFRYG